MAFCKSKIKWHGCLKEEVKQILCSLTRDRTIMEAGRQQKYTLVNIVCQEKFFEEILMLFRTKKNQAIIFIFSPSFKFKCS